MKAIPLYVATIFLSLMVMEALKTFPLQNLGKGLQINGEIFFWVITSQKYVKSVF
jgi:hypothetical protein